MTRSWDHGYAGYAGYAGGAVIGVASAVFFGAAGALAKPLLLAGWTPAAVALVRVAGGAMLLLPWVWWSMRGRWHHLPGHARAVLGYGVFGVAATQLAYFSAVETLSVSVALLLEYSAVVMVVGWMWVRHDQAPSRLTALGVALAVVGLVLVLGLLTGARLSTVGVAWALCAAVGLAVYFVLSAGDSGDALPPAALAGCGLLVGALVVGSAALGGLVDVRVVATDVDLGGRAVAWWVPLGLLALFAAALAYVTGIVAARRLGARLMSCVGLTEVLFATLFAWLLLGERPGWLQGVGGALLVAGIVVVRLGEVPTTVVVQGTPGEKLSTRPDADVVVWP